MARVLCGYLLILAVLIPPIATAQTRPQSGGDFSSSDEPIHPQAKLPKGAILVKGAWSSASDSTTPVPEGGSVVGDIFRNQYFAMNYPVPNGWFEEYKGPPPSDTGRYVLLQLSPSDTRNQIRGTILITAQDMFFNPLPAANALQLVNYSKDHLQADHKLELAPTATKIGGRPFEFFAYWSPVARLHWYVLTTESRCHAVQIIMTSQDTKLLESLVLAMNKMQVSADADPSAGRGGGDVPVCIANYATEDHVEKRIEPVFSERTFNPVPVRIIIDKTGHIKHVHFLSAFPSQSKAIGDALRQWKFKPYVVAGHPAEVETGIMFGRAPNRMNTQAQSASVE